MPTYTALSNAMTARAIGARTDAAGAAVADLSAEEDRFANLVVGAGVARWLQTNAFAVALTGGMGVSIGSGVAKADVAYLTGTVAGQGRYVVRKEDATVTRTLDAADATLNRIDSFYAVAEDLAYDTTARGIARLYYVKGDTASSPVAPAANAAWRASLRLVDVRVRSTANGGGSLIAADIASPWGAAAATAQLVADASTLGGLAVTNLMRVYGTGPTIIPSGGSVPAGAQLLFQTGSTVVSTNANGGWAINFPVAFPSGLLSVRATNGDGDFALSLLDPNHSLGAFQGKGHYLAGGATLPGGTAIRVNWDATGW